MAGTRGRKINQQNGNAYMDCLPPRHMGLSVPNEEVVLPIKDAAASKAAVVCGLSLKNGNNLLAAIRECTKAVALAPPEEKETKGMAHDARSQVLYTMQRYKACGSEIVNALTLGCPRELLKPIISRLGSSCRASGEQLDSLKTILIVASKCLDKMQLSMEEKASLQSQLTAEKEKISKMSVTKRFESFVNQEMGMKTVFMEELQLKPPPVTDGASTKLPQTSKDLKLMYSMKLGLHLVALKEIAAGAVLVVSSPYVGLPLPSSRYSHCSACLKRCETMIVCPRCTWAVFCSPQCRENFAQTHTFECLLMPNVVSAGGSIHAQMLLRWLSKETVPHVLESFRDFHSRKTTGGRLEDDYLRALRISDLMAFLHLENHAKKRKSLGKMGTFQKDGERFVDALWGGKVKDKPLLVKVAVHALQTLAMHTRFTGGLINTPTGSQPEAPCAAAIYIGTSLFLHSCNPNTEAIPYGYRQEAICAVQPIATGSVLTLSYGPHFQHQTLPVRQAAIQTMFLSPCVCDACVENWSHLSPSLKPLISSFSNEHAASVVQGALKDLKNNVPLSVDQVRLLGFAMVAVRSSWQHGSGQSMLPCPLFFTMVRIMEAHLRLVATSRRLLISHEP